MLELINSVYTGLQQLQIQPSRHNIGILAECLQILETIAGEIAADGDKDQPEEDPENDPEEDPEEKGKGEGHV